MYVVLCEDIKIELRSDKTTKCHEANTNLLRRLIFMSKCLSFVLAKAEQSRRKFWDVSTSSFAIQFLQLAFGKMLNL